MDSIKDVDEAIRVVALNAAVGSYAHANFSTATTNIVDRAKVFEEYIKQGRK